MSEQHNSTTTLEERQQQVATWIAGIFIGLSLAFLIYSIYIVIVDQQGRFDLSDAVLMPLTVVMLGVSLVSFWLIRKGRLTLGTGLLFVILVLVPPIVAVLVLQDFGMTSVSYIVLLASIMIGLVLPRSSRRPAVIASVVAILIIDTHRSFGPGISYCYRYWWCCKYNNHPGGTKSAWTLCASGMARKYSPKTGYIIYYCGIDLNGYCEHSGLYQLSKSST